MKNPAMIVGKGKDQMKIYNGIVLMTS